ncbi:alpha-L-fucosidase, partial [Acinetobacter baumannii]
ALIHQLQPQCLIGNNHHLEPFAGEDFQMFEKDLPGENKGGLSFQKPSALPLETCETINNSWGYNITDTTYKSNKELIDYLVKAS